MNRILITLLLGLACSLALAADEVPLHPYIEIVTTEGTIILELDGKQAPLTVGHFLKLVDDGFYDGITFHRVIPGFMAQTGGYSPDLKHKESDDSIPNESGNGLSNVRGTVAMARTSDPHSANSQFFINVGDNKRLDPGKKSVGGTWGYTVFGSVIQGMDVVDRIVNVRTGPQGSFASDVPLVPIVIEKMARYTFQ
jgi:cyclophilin family peptidyl-prolyl cis-trans isomerase